MAKEANGYLQVKPINPVYEGMLQTFAHHGIKSAQLVSLRQMIKMLTERKRIKPRLYVLSFTGDVQASGVGALAKEISAILAVIGPEDEVLLKLESPGGAVHAYGLASTELERLTQANIRLTVVVDKVAASGGYMMACVSDRIVAAPMAILGSIGVIAEVPNISRLLDRLGIRYEQVVAGDHKQPLSIFTENTAEGREKFQEDILRTHELFRAHVQRHRSIKEFDKVSNGGVFYGQEAVSKNLVDELGTSEELLIRYCKTHQVFGVHWHWLESWADRFGWAAGASLSALFGRVNDYLVSVAVQQPR